MFRCRCKVCAWVTVTVAIFVLVGSGSAADTLYNDLGTGLELAYQSTGGIPFTKNLGGVPGALEDWAKEMGPYARAAGKVEWAIGKVALGVGITRKILLNLGTEVILEVKYEPEDAPKAIHRKHDPDEPTEERRIRLDATVNYQMDYEKEWKRNLYNPPRLGPQSDVQVLWFFPTKLWRHAEFRYPDCWDGQHPTLFNHTNDNGVATAYIYPTCEQQYGGVKRIFETRIEAAPMLQQGISLDFVDAAGAIVEQIATVAGLTKVSVPVRIEYHEPTRWTGTIHLTQSMTANWADRRPPPDKGQGRVVNKSGGYNWVVEVDITDIELDEVGSGQGRYSSVYVNGFNDDYQLELIRDSEGHTFKNEITTHWEGHGENEWGEVEVNLTVSTDGEKYRVEVNDKDIGLRAASIPWFQQSGTQTREYHDAEGRLRTKTDAYDPGYSFGACMLPGLFQITRTKFGPFSDHEWIDFDPDAQTLSGEVTSEKRWASRNGKVSYSYRTTISYNLTRIMPEQ